MRSSGKRPRNSSLAKDGLSQPLSRDSSATALACSSLTCACCAIGLPSLEPTPLEIRFQCSPQRCPAHAFTQQLHNLWRCADQVDLRVEFASHRFDHLGDSAGGLAVWVAALAQLRLYGPLQQGDHVLDHAVQLIWAVLVLGRALP